jgi:hypothetical protein
MWWELSAWRAVSSRVERVERIDLHVDQRRIQSPSKLLRKIAQNI